MQVGSIKLDSNVVCLSWNTESNRLLIGAKNGSIQIWSYNSNCSNDSACSCVESSTLSKLSSSSVDKLVKFSICEESESQTSEQKHEDVSCRKERTHESASTLFKKIWETKLSNPIKCLKFSPDGLLFASYGEVKTESLDNSVLIRKTFISSLFS